MTAGAAACQPARSTLPGDRLNCRPGRGIRARWLRRTRNARSGSPPRCERTSDAAKRSRADAGKKRKRPKADASGVAVAQLGFAQRAVDPGRNRVADPDDGAEKDDGKG